ncbi:DUF4258 domain-containing protein [Tenacibaculum sp. E3R01]|uniref:DUF4258 domain-containing protein n=1 Tax=Tenacibaculum sp. E3R01 TaxID=2267227 RepID=UPI000DE9910E|nr:DUF4258 domain-containing protein [Tenacibaculum sp. E3R01]RBW56622.1 DUF4258 domain-containing protein [Tenacibaculum sp. E3R01]
MQLLKRFGYYLIGLALGSVAVLFFWKNKNVSFDYGMDARTLKSIRIKKRLFSNDVKQILATKKIDTSYISQILKNGDVDFGKSKARQKPCAEYYITGKDSLKNMSLYVTRCDSTSTINKIILK